MLLSNKVGQHVFMHILLYVGIVNSPRTWSRRRKFTALFPLFKHLEARTGKDKLLIIHRADTGPVITLYYIISKFRWVIRLVINSLHEQVLTSALCICNTAPHNRPLTNQPCVEARVFTRSLIPPSPLSEMGSVSCDSLQRRDGVQGSRGA